MSLRISDKFTSFSRAKLIDFSGTGNARNLNFEFVPRSSKFEVESKTANFLKMNTAYVDEKLGEIIPRLISPENPRNVISSGRERLRTVEASHFATKCQIFPKKFNEE